MRIASATDQHRRTEGERHDRESQACRRYNRRKTFRALIGGSDPVT